MTTLPKANGCTGCAACANVCPFAAIVMSRDNEGFLYPNVDSAKCRRCGLCANACPSLNRKDPRNPIGVYAVKAKDEKLRLASSSGGVFSLLAMRVLSQGGVVFGAAFDRSDWKVRHICVDTVEGLEQLRGSKYVQSEMADCYRRVNRFLQDGRKVLFSGTPCQIAGLNGFLGKSEMRQRENLLLVDLICHAAPSPLAWEKYLAARVRCAYNGREGGKIRRISSRRKDYGWRRFSVSLDFANDTEYLSEFSRDAFMRGFLSELYNRPSCHACPFKSLRSGADLTLGDYWGVQTRFPNMDDDKGTSLVIVNTALGSSSFEDIREDVESLASDFSHACKTNPAIQSSTCPHRNRQKFFARVGRSDFDGLVAEMLKPPLKARLRAFAGRTLRKLGLRK